MVSLLSGLIILPLIYDYDHYFKSEFCLLTDALVKLTEVGVNTTLRYAVQLLTPASIAADINGRVVVSAEDVQEVSNLFMDAKSSAAMLATETFNLK